MKKIITFFVKESLRAVVILSLVVGGVAVYAQATKPASSDIASGKVVKSSHLSFLFDRFTTDGRLKAGCADGQTLVFEGGAAKCASSSGGGSGFIGLGSFDRANAYICKDTLGVMYEDTDGRCACSSGGLSCGDSLDDTPCACLAESGDVTDFDNGVAGLAVIGRGLRHYQSGWKCMSMSGNIENSGGGCSCPVGKLYTIYNSYGRGEAFCIDDANGTIAVEGRVLRSEFHGDCGPDQGDSLTTTYYGACIVGTPNEECVSFFSKRECD